MLVDSKLQEGSTNPDGTIKPTIKIMCDGYSYYVYYHEGLEGYHEKLTNHLDVKYEEHGKTHLVYLNHGYFLIKPVMHVLKYRYTGTPEKEGFKIQKKGGNKMKSAIFELKDVKTGREGVLWVYTNPRNIMEWQAIKTQLEKIIDSAEAAGLKPDEDGYLPLVLKIGKSPRTTLAFWYAAVVALTGETDVDEYLLMEFTSDIAWNSYGKTLPNNNEFEVNGVPKYLHEAGLVAKDLRPANDDTRDS